jgi:Transglycosylase-like domain
VTTTATASPPTIAQIGGSPAVAAQVLADGGTAEQAWVAAALVSGIESGPSDPTSIKNPTSTASGLFQFLTSTWIGNGGGQYANTAGDASWQDQVAVFVDATKGNNFGDWGPDLGYSGYGNSGPPLEGSKVATHISALSASGKLSFIAAQAGSLPADWIFEGADAGILPPGTLGELATGAAQAAGAATGTGGAVSTAVGAVETFTSIASAVETLTGDILDVNFWKRVGLFFGGATLILIGLAIFISTTKPGQQAISTGSQAAALAAVA